MIEKEEKTITNDNPSAPSTGAGGDALLGAYSPRGLFTYDLSTEQWEKEQKEGHNRWKDSPRGRLGIRMFSRGVMGALGFTWGGYMISSKMAGYNPNGPAKNLLQRFAHAIDHNVGSTIEQAVNALGYDGKAAVTFRETAKFGGYDGMGRSLAHEGLGVSGDFFCMSIGDFWGRKFADTLDPNNRKDWLNDDGSVDYEKAASRFAKNWWTAISYSGGEDIAVTLPYIYTMKFGRKHLERLHPGFAQDFDVNGSGASFRVNDHGKVTGNYAGVGLFNFTERFTTYNIGTLWYREAYSWIGDKLHHQRSTGEMPALVQDNPDKPERTPGEIFTDGVKQFTRWAARDVVKGTLYMVPSAMVFGALRPWQHKFRGAFIHPEKGMLVYGEGTPVRANSAWLDAAFTPKTPVRFSRTGETVENPFAQGFDAKQTFGGADSLLSPLGHVNDKARELLYPISNWLNHHAEGVRQVTGLPLDPSAQGKLRLQDGHALTNTYVSAALAYTPYFWAKSDMLAHYWDSGSTDISIERMLDGAATLNPKEVAAGANELLNSLRGDPLPDPAREKEAQRRIAADLSPSDNEYDLKREIHTLHAPVNLTPTKQGFAERLRDHKEQAQTRMQDFRRRAEPRSHVESIGRSAEPPHETGFAQEEEHRKIKTAGSHDFPAAGTTFH